MHVSAPENQARLTLAKRIATLLVRNSIPDDAPHCADAVFPADLFAVGIGAAVVTDRPLENSEFSASNLGCQFRLDVESFLFQRRSYVADHVAGENLVAGFHVRHIQIRKAVG